VDCDISAFQAFRSAESVEHHSPRRKAWARFKERLSPARAAFYLQPHEIKPIATIPNIYYKLFIPIL
jgi:hypothetical protein